MLKLSIYCKANHDVLVHLTNVYELNIINITCFIVQYFKNIAIYKPGNILKTMIMPF